MKQRQGFTIVELLIVIVVIAILAAITVVAYNEAQTRAYYARLSSSVKAYSNALSMYKVDSGNYPPAEWKCLGRLEDYPKTDDFEKGVCLTDGSYKEVWDADIAEYISRYLTNMPTPNYPTVPDDHGYRVRGLEYDSATSGFDRPTITFYMKGDKHCPIGEKVHFSARYNSTRCAHELP